MLIKTAKEITRISDDDKINNENYFESLSFVEELYLFLNKLKLVVPISDVQFEPSFKGRFTCEKYNLESTEEENSMRCFIISSMLFLEDTTREKLNNVFDGSYDAMYVDRKNIKIIMKQ